MKKRLHGCPEALVSPEEGDSQTADTTETTSDPQSTTQVQSVELHQGLYNTHSAFDYDFCLWFTTCNLHNHLCIVVLSSLYC